MRFLVFAILLIYIADATTITKQQQKPLDSLNPRGAYVDHPHQPPRDHEDGGHNGDPPEPSPPPPPMSLLWSIEQPYEQFYQCSWKSANASVVATTSMSSSSRLGSISVYDVTASHAIWGQGFSSLTGPIYLSSSQGQFATLYQSDYTGIFNFWSYDNKMPLFTTTLPSNQYPIPYHSVLYSGDGMTAVLAYQNYDWSTVVWKDIFGKTTNLWTEKEDLIGDIAVSYDGSFIVVDLQYTFVVLDTANASVVFQSPSETGGSKDSVMCASSDARFVVHGGPNMAYIHNFGATWSSPTINQHAEPGMIFYGCAFGKNTLALVFYNGGFTAQTRVVIYDISMTTRQPTWTWNSEGQEPGNNPTQLLVSSDGKFIALTSLGTIYNNVPQIILWSSGSSTPVASYLAKGSLYSLDMVYSGNALRLVTCGKEGHKSVAGSDGEIYVLEYTL